MPPSMEILKPFENRYKILRICFLVLHYFESQSRDRLTHSFWKHCKRDEGQCPAKEFTLTYNFLVSVLSKTSLTLPFEMNLNEAFLTIQFQENYEYGISFKSRVSGCNEAVSYTHLTLPTIYSV